MSRRGGSRGGGGRRGGGRSGGGRQGGSPPNAPSKTGNPSGGGRGKQSTALAVIERRSGTVDRGTASPRPSGKGRFEQHRSDYANAMVTRYGATPALAWPNAAMKSRVRSFKTP